MYPDYEYAKNGSRSVNHLLRNFLILGVGFATALTAPSVNAELRGAQGMETLLDQVNAELGQPGEQNQFYIKAERTDDVESGEAAMYINHPVSRLSVALGSSSSWCEILPLHINVKACTYDNDGDSLSLYLGPKSYQDPDDAFEIVYRFQSEFNNDYLSAVALADEGPLGTSNYHIEIEAIPSKDEPNQSFMRIYLSNHQSWLSSRAMDVYLATKGSEKQGISITGYDSVGNPVYSSGALAVAERNLLRYYFAFDAYFDALSIEEPEKRLEAQLNSWFDKTEDYPQLHELEKQEYLADKRRERNNQKRLQAEMGPDSD